MKTIKPSNNEAHWPRHEVKAIEARKRDLVIRITDWTDDKEEPAYDVEVYIGGVYDWNESEIFSLHKHTTKAMCKKAAITYTQNQIKKLL
jgi:hypothetical protein